MGGSMNPKPSSGTLIIIGGGEDREGPGDVLREVVRLSGEASARIVVMTAATEHPEEMAEEYRRAFGKLGVRDVRHVDTPGRAEADDPARARVIEDATCVFFTGGDQNRITEFLKGTRCDEAIRRRYGEGLVIAGTSAGA